MTDIIGIPVALPDRCRNCGCSTALVGSHRRLLCEGCECGRGLIGAELRSFLETFHQQFGPPEGPIILRTGKVHKPEPPASAAETELKLKRKRRKVKMKADTLFPSKYLKSSDLGGKPKVVTISSVSYDEMKNDGKAETKAVLHFANDAARPLVVNKSKYLALVSLTGEDDCDDWVGTEISLVPCKVAFKGKLVDSIKVDESPRSKRPIGEEMNDEIGI